MRIPKLVEIGLATALTGMVVSGCEEESEETGTIEATAEDCRDLKEQTGLWWYKEGGGLGNRVREACIEILFQANQSDKEE
jgi:hypothetical protein